MPTYDYKCDACGNTFEKFQSITAAPIKQCPACKKPKAKRLIGTGAGLIFKGSGFYITDYRDSGYKDAAKKDAGGDSKPSTDTASNTPASKESTAKPAEAKPAAATESKPAASAPAPAKPSKKK